MPLVAGIEAAEKITQARPIPIILLTATTRHNWSERAAQANIRLSDEPVAEEDLLPASRWPLARFRQFQALRQEVADLREALEARQIIERPNAFSCAPNPDRRGAFRRLQKQSQDSNHKFSQVRRRLWWQTNFMIRT